MSYDRRNGLSDADWNDDTCVCVEKLDDDELLAEFENEIKRQHYDPSGSSFRSMFSPTELRDEMLRRMRQES